MPLSNDLSGEVNGVLLDDVRLCREENHVLAYRQCCLALSAHEAMRVHGVPRAWERAKAPRM